MSEMFSFSKVHVQKVKLHVSKTLGTVP